MDQQNNEVQRLLDRIASDANKAEISSGYNNAESVMKESGATSNNMLLCTICAESKRCADITSRLESRVARMEHNLTIIASTLSKLCALTETQNTILSSHANIALDMQPSVQTPQASRYASEASAWYYQGVKLTSKYKICACIISHLMELVRLKMENEKIYYPDSVDANFTVMEYCVRDSSKVRCNISAVSFKDDIKIPDTSKAATAYESILPLIASRDPCTITTLVESRLSELCTPITRSIMESVSRIVERIRYIERLLSPQQIDILRSLRFPVSVNRTGEQSILNWDRSVIEPHATNPMSALVSGLSPTQKTTFIKSIMKGQNTTQAYRTATN